MSGHAQHCKRRYVLRLHLLSGGKNEPIASFLFLSLVPYGARAHARRQAGARGAELSWTSRACAALTLAGGGREWNLMEGRSSG